MSRTTANLLRVISIVAVMAIHATARGEWIFIKSHVFFSDAFLGILLNQLARFSVPLFVVLSGYGLTLKYAAGDGGMGRKQTVAFFRGRAMKILLPFVFWTVLFFFLLKRYSWDPGFSFSDIFVVNLPLLFKYLTTSGVDYHFYFFIIILQCYLVFPLLFRYRRRWLWWVLLLVQIVFTAPSHHLFAMIGFKRPGFFSAFLLYWLFWFYTGIMLADRRERIVAAIERLKGWVIVGFSILAAGIVVGEYIYKTYTQSNPDWFNHFARWTVIVYALAVLALFLKFDGKVRDWLERSPVRFKMVTRLAGLSFCVYIFHVWPLRWLQQLAGPFQIVLFVLLLSAICFSGALVLSRLIRRPGWMRLLLGL